MSNATGGQTTTMVYSGIGNTQRASETSSGSTTSFTNNPFGVASATAGGATTGYTYDPTGRLNSILNGGSRYYYLYDGNGNIIGLINTSGALEAAYTYDPYGNLTSSSGSLALTNPYRYKAGYTDPTGYINYGARYYSPAAGAWTQLDPSGQNPGYQYAADDPINESDPSGQCFADFLGSHCHSVVDTLVTDATADVTGALVVERVLSWVSSQS